MVVTNLIKRAISDFTKNPDNPEPVYGRTEIIPVTDKHVFIFLKDDEKSLAVYRTRGDARREHGISLRQVVG